MRKFIAYGEPAGSAVMIDEIEDGAIVTVAEREKGGQVILDAEALMTLTKQSASIFGHVVVHEGEWRDKLTKIVNYACERNEARCLDDEIDRSVVVQEIVRALVAAGVAEVSQTGGR
jgi:hypothetical protein